MSYIVTAGYVTVETAVAGGRAHIDIPRGELLPADVPDEQREALLARGAIEPADGDPTVEEPAVQDALPPDVSEIPAGMSVSATLEWVGTDPARAGLALTAETGPGGQNRSTLVQRLEAIVAAAEKEAGDAGAGAGASVDS